MLAAVNNFLKYVDDLVWGVPLIVAILLTGIYLTIRLKGIQITKLPKAVTEKLQVSERYVRHFPQPSVLETLSV